MHTAVIYIYWSHELTSTNGKEVRLPESVFVFPSHMPSSLAGGNKTSPALENYSALFHPSEVWCALLYLLLLLLFWSHLAEWPVTGPVSPCDSWRSRWLTICLSRRASGAQASYWICCCCRWHWPETSSRGERWAKGQKEKREWEITWAPSAWCSL